MKKLYVHYYNFNFLCFPLFSNIDYSGFRKDRYTTIGIFYFCAIPWFFPTIIITSRNEGLPWKEKVWWYSLIVSFFIFNFLINSNDYIKTLKGLLSDYGKLMIISERVYQFALERYIYLDQRDCPNIYNFIFRVLPTEEKNKAEESAYETSLKQQVAILNRSKRKKNFPNLNQMILSSLSLRLLFYNFSTYFFYIFYRLSFLLPEFIVRFNVVVFYIYFRI